MRLVAAVLVAGAVSLAACGAVPAAGSPLTPVQLKYRLVEQVGPIEYCDRDQYPLAREVTPDYVYQQLAYIRAHDPQVYQAILDHYQLSAPTTDQQKLQVDAQRSRTPPDRRRPGGGEQTRPGRP